VPKIFLDSNIVLYAFTSDARSAIAESLLAEGPDLSVQVLNEFVNVARKKLEFDWKQIEEALKAIHALAGAIHPIDFESHSTAVVLARRYGFSFYDALIVASARIAQCEVLYSEDMQHGQTIGGLTIRNPFREV
jgi:predicted nucleic acid-binding protein